MLPVLVTPDVAGLRASRRSSSPAPASAGLRSAASRIAFPSVPGPYPQCAGRTRRRAAAQIASCTTRCAHCHVQQPRRGRRKSDPNRIVAHINSDDRRRTAYAAGHDRIMPIEVTCMRRLLLGFAFVLSLATALSAQSPQAISQKTAGMDHKDGLFPLDWDAKAGSFTWKSRALTMILSLDQLPTASAPTTSASIADNWAAATWSTSRASAAKSCSSSPISISAPQPPIPTSASPSPSPSPNLSYGATPFKLKRTATSSLTPLRSFCATPSRSRDSAGHRPGRLPRRRHPQRHRPRQHQPSQKH